MFIFVASVAFHFSVAVTEMLFGPLDQIASIYGWIFHMLFLIPMHLGLTLPVLPTVRIWIRELFFGFFVKESSETASTNIWIPSANARRLAVGLFVAVMGWMANVLSFTALGRELSGALFWGINLAWIYLCYAWIFRGSRPPQGEGALRPRGNNGARLGLRFG